MKANITDIETVKISTFIAQPNEGKTCETWKVSLRGETKQAWFKLSRDPYQLISEIVCAKVGRAVGLSIPEPKIGIVQQNKSKTLIPKQSDWHNEDGLIIGFVSMNVGKKPISFERLMRNNNHHIIKQWGGLNNAMVFDEWIANTDRNTGNLLHDGNTGYWLIDHGDALTGAQHQLYGLDKIDITVTNELLNNWRDKNNQVHVEKLIKDAHLLLNASHDIPFTDLNNDNSLLKIKTDIDINAIINFISQRVYLTTDLLCHKLNIPILNFSQAKNAPHNGKHFT